MIELPDFLTGAAIERIYGRMVWLQNHGREPSWNGGVTARYLRRKGIRMAKDRNPRMMVVLEKATAYLHHRNEEQKSRMAQLGYQTTDFSEYSLFKVAYEKADDPRLDELAEHAIFGWVYAAVAEFLG